MMMSRVLVPALLASLLLAGCSSDCCKDCCSTAPAKAEPAAVSGGAKSLFDGKTLGAWKSVDFGGEGAVKVENGAIRVDAGATCSGIQWTGEAPPRTNYE